jgi:hypothetical protein
MASDPITSTGQRPAGAIVLIGCKHPGGVVLNLDHYTLVDERNLRVRLDMGKMTVVLKGWSHPVNRPDPTEGTGGYVLTPVSKDFWDQWLAEHRDFPMLADKTIIGPHTDAKGQARDLAAVPQMFARSDGTLRGSGGRFEAEALTKE